MKKNFNRVQKIRNWIRKKELDALIIPHADEYLSEYVPPENERLAWATGFTGSAGLTVITDTKGALFVDGRYTVQVKEQVDSSLYETLHIKDTPWAKWIEQNLQANAKIGYDPRLHQANWEENTKKLLEENFTLVPIDENPIDVFWENRPKPNKDKALLLDEIYTGKSSIEKRISMAKEISKNKCDAAFITQLDSIAWLLNIRGNDVPCNPLLLCHGLLYADGAFELYINEDKIPKYFHNHVGRDVSVMSPNSLIDKITKLSGKIIQLDSASSNNCNL
jgi:Xaa-Pro aminopeptidase